MIFFDGRCLSTLGGAGEYAFRVFRELDRLQPGRIRLVNRHMHPALRVEASDIFRPLLPGRVQNFLWRHLAWFPFDCFARDCGVFFTPTGILPRLKTGTPAVMTALDFAYRRFDGLVSAKNRDFLDYWLGRSMARSDHIIAISHATAADLQEFFGIPPDRISMIHLACDTGRYRPVDGPGLEAARLLLRPRNLPERFILFLGTLEPRKNLFNLVRAYEKIRYGIAPVKLVLAGRKGWLVDDVFAHIAGRGLSDDIILMGAVGDDEKLALYQTCEFFVLPSLYEGFGMPILEAMACGRAVLTSDGSSMREIAGDAARLVDPHDVDDIAKQMQVLALDSSARDRLARRGIERAQAFSWEKTARATLEILQRFHR